MLLVVSGDNPTRFEKVNPDNFSALNIWERKHIQQWIRQVPELLGEELLVVSMEFDRFRNSDDRLDLLALDRNANLVVIELKRDPLAGYADLQAIRYAAMVSSMTIEKLIPWFVAYQRKYQDLPEASHDSAQEQIRAFINDRDTGRELSSKPRIILCSEDFSTELTTTVLWLNQNGLDISCVRIKPHKIDNRIIIVPTKIIPLQEARQYLIEVQHKEEEKNRTAVTGKRQATMTILIESGRLKAGDKIYLKRYLPSYVQFEPENPVFIAEITGKLGQQDNLRWLYDGEEYSITALTQLIFRQHHPEHLPIGPIQGGIYWQTADGYSLTALADEIWSSRNPV